ncbi:MAG: carbohydrate ABC transporter permease [Anaerolineae bacterium]|nr:carbohydrate ABC transporter permease [Anaerolineae bacterium]
MIAKLIPNRNQLIIFIILTILLILIFIPIIYLIILSLKDNGQIYGRFWSLPNPVRWENFALGWQVISRPILNSVVSSGTATLGNIVFASLAGYAFARHQFPGKEILYTAILMLLMVPPILMLIPEFVLISSIGLLNTLWALILPWMAGGQVFSLLLFRTFFSTLPEDFFDAARIDGASEFRVFWHIAIPLSKPIIITIAIIRLVATYNQYIRPLLMISDPHKQVVAVAITQFTSDIGVTDLGPQMAAYIVATIPLIIFFSFGMRYYVAGLTSGGIRA